jgi:hypothetical protein
MVVSSNEKLFALIVSVAYALIGTIIATVKHNKIKERKTPLVEALLMCCICFISQLNLEGYFTAFVFVIRVLFISKLL